MRERQLEDLLFHHPYLIDAEFAGLMARRQQTKGRQRLDLACELPSGLCIIELKKTVLTPNDLRQIVRYCRAWAKDKKKLADHHYLIGKRPFDESRLLRAAAQSEFEIRLRYLGEHLPLKLAWDTSARQYRSLDESVVTADYLEFRL